MQWYRRHCDTWAFRFDRWEVVGRLQVVSKERIPLYWQCCNLSNPRLKNNNKGAWPFHFARTCTGVFVVRAMAGQNLEPPEVSRLERQRGYRQHDMNFEWFSVGRFQWCQYYVYNGARLYIEPCKTRFRHVPMATGVAGTTVHSSFGPSLSK